MLSNAQKARIKQGQREARLGDPDYREVIRTVTGGVSCADPSLGDRDFDRIMGALEGEYWFAVDRGRIQHAPHPRSSFQARGYWAAKNTPGETSRDRFNADQLATELARLECQAAARGLSHAYLDGIRKRSGGGWKYRAALQRTLKAGTMPGREGG